MITLQFSYNEDDYVPAWRRYLLRKPNFIALFVLIYLLSLGFLKLILSSGIYFDLSWFLICSIGSLLGLFGLVFYVLPHQRYRHSYRAVEEYRFQIEEHGIFYETEYDSGVLPWRRCTKLVEGKRFYLFEHDRRRITVIPKRVFKNQEEENDFRAILRSKLPPAFSAKLLKDKNPQPGEGYVPPEKAPDWR